MKSLAHIEIEHKFIVPRTFELSAFRRKMTDLGCIRTTRISVSDTYYASPSFPDKIFRHRLDKEIQHLTVKSKGLAADARMEINLLLTNGDQSLGVQAFFNAMGKFRSIIVKKKVEAFYFNDCEIVFYVASSGRRTARCVEFEATTKRSLKSARKILKHYEVACGFDQRLVEPKSLFELLVLPQLRPPLRNSGNH